MDTRILKIDPVHPEENVINEAAGIIRGGGVAAFPTETVYGLGADAMLPEGALRIYEAKGRPSDNPLIVHIADFDALERIVGAVPREAELLAGAFWPGPLTMILPKSGEVPYETTGGLDTVAVRMPSHPAARALIRAAGGYIAAPSANLSGKPSPTTAEHVAQDLCGRIPLILDGGSVGIGIESTIVDLTGPERYEGGRNSAGALMPRILRPGYITGEMIAEAVGSVEEDPALTSADDGAAPKAPGMKYRHYAPDAELTLVSGNRRDVVGRINALAAQDRQAGIRTGVICTKETLSCYHADIVKCIGSRKDEADIARHLYALLREFDEEGAERIYSECFSDLAIGRAVMNRLEKAAGHHVIEA